MMLLSHCVSGTADIWHYLAVIGLVVGVEIVEQNFVNFESLRITRDWD